jgi:cation:H+ antiporter
MSTEELKEYREEVRELQQAPIFPAASLWRNLGLITAGVAFLAGGAQATIAGAVQLAEMWGMSERVIGLTIVAAGTGLPEVVTSLVSSWRGRDDVAIANVIGSNMFNILAILGLSALVQPMPVAAGIIASDGWWMLGVTLLLFPLMFTGMRINRWEGLFLLGCYAVYMALLLLHE